MSKKEIRKEILSQMKQLDKRTQTSCRRMVEESINQ